VTQLELDPSAVLADLDELAAASGGRFAGARRLAWSPDWLAARAWLREKLGAIGLTASEDVAGNLWATVPGEADEFVVVGSHIDAVPDGGWLDGALGLLTALETVRQLARNETPAPLSVRFVDWADEEGARFGLSLMGSMAATGRLDPAFVAELRDAGGVTAREALAGHGVDVTRMPEARGGLDGAIGYLELHIEQGPVLESRGLPLAVVSGTYGAERWAVRFTGQAAHAGSTPMDLRRDALLAASRLALAVRELAGAHGGVGTVGRITAEPGIVTAVAGVATALVDQRHNDAGALAAAHAGAVAAADAIAAEERVEVEWSPLFQIHPIPFDAGLIDAAAAIVEELQGVDVRLPSGPLHDAAWVADSGVPTVMLFVRSKRGLSHTREEDTDEPDLALGLRALARLAVTVLSG
jgi:N-carbamoyl-L-amino-acid hydrolase